MRADKLQKQYLELINKVLPSIALKRNFPIKLNHCFGRTCLDQLFQGCWYEFLVVGKIPAYRQLDVDQLQQLVDIAQSLVDGDLEHIHLLNQQSLDWDQFKP